MCRVVTSYAKAMLRLGQERGVLDRLYTDMGGLVALCEAHESLVMLLKHPSVAKREKQALFRRLLATKVHPFTWNMLVRVFQQRHAHLLLKISKAFLSGYNQYRNIKQGVLITAWPLGEAEVFSLRDIAKRVVPCQRVTLQPVVDGSLLGGYILRIGDKQLDRSFRCRLRTLRNRFMHPGDAS